MDNTQMIIVAFIVFVITGILSYVVEEMILRGRGVIGRDESLYAYFKRIDQKNGNITAAVWAVIWILMIVVFAILFYLIS